MNEMTKLCKNCFRRDICGNSRTTWCTGYAPYVETRWDADDIKTPPFTDAQERVIQATEKLNEKCNKINADVNKWGRKRICDVDDDM